MIHVLIESNLRKLVQLANTKSIEKEEIITILPQDGQYVLIYTDKDE